MKFCTNCGNKLDTKNKFCTNCGKEIKKEVAKTTKKEVKKEEPKKEFNVNNLVLYAGVSLVILSTFIFAICTWENMSGLFKISFLTFEALLFFIISFVFAKIKDNGLSKAFYMMAVLMIPVILYTIPVYNLLGEYLSYKGAGIFVYLAISNAICAGIYLMSYFLLKFKPFAYTSYIFIYACLVNIFLAFEKSITFFLLASLVYILIVIIINFINRKQNYFRKSITFFTSILFSVLSFCMPVLIVMKFSENYIFGFSSINIYLVLITLLFFVNTFVFIYQNRKSFYTYFSPFIVVPVLISILTATIKSEYVFIPVLVGGTLALYGLYLIFKNKYLKITSKIITYITLYSILLLVICGSTYSYDYLLTMAIVSFIVLAFNIINRFTEKNKWASDSLIPLSCLFMVIGIINYIVDIPAVFTMLLASSIYLVIYMLLKALNGKTNKIYFGYAIGALVISFLLCTFDTDGIFIIFLNILLMLLFIYVSFMEKSIAINICTFILLTFSLLKVRILIDIDIRIIFACISLISITVGIILKNKSRGLSKFYLFFGEIISLLLALSIGTYTSYIVIALIGVLFAVSFMSICLYNNYKGYRITAEVIGLILIFSIVNSLVEVTLFSSIITLFIYMVILVILGLTGKEKGGTIIILSTACLLPYYDYALSYSTGIENQLVIIPFIIYLFVFTLFFKMKYETRMHSIIWPLIIFSLIAINTTTIGIIISLALALAYIFIGLIKKYQYLITFGMIYILVVLVFECFRLFNNLALIIAVLLIGLALITYVVINEVYKSKKNK